MAKKEATRAEKRLQKKIQELEEEVENLKHYRKLMRLHIQAKRNAILVYNSGGSALITHPIVGPCGLSGFNLNADRWKKLEDELLKKNGQTIGAVEVTMCDSEGGVINALYELLLNDEEPS